MAKPSRYRCHHSKVSARLLAILLILPSFPEETYQAEYHYHHQKQQAHAPPRYYHQNSNVNNYGEIRGVQGKGYHKRMSQTQAPTTVRTTVVPAPAQYIFQKQAQAPPQMHRFSTPQGIITIQQVPSLPSYIRNPVKQQLQIPKQKQIIKLLSQHPPFPLAIRQDSSPVKCEGRKNIIDDIGLFSLVTAVMSSTFGFYTIMINSMTSNNIGIVSGFMSLVLWLPSVLLSIFNFNGEFANLISHTLNTFSFLNSMYGFMGVVFGTADVLASAAGESVGIISFIMSLVATFPEFLDALVEYLYRIGNKSKLEYYIENYGCEVPGLFRWYGKSFYKLVNDFLIGTVAIKDPREMITAQNNMRY